MFLFILPMQTDFSYNYFKYVITTELIIKTTYDYDE